MKKTFLLLVMLMLVPLAGWTKPLVADLSQYRIEIDSNFAGTQLLLFGSRNDTGDIVVVVRGPAKKYTVRKKERVAGIWVNSESRKFDNVLAYYAIASSKAFSQIHPSDLFAPLHIGLAQVVSSTGKTDAEFAAALLRHEQENRLYSQAPQRVSFMGESLFKLVLPFPDNIPRGNYSADVYLFNDGQLVGMQSIPLRVDKTGFDAFMYDFAHQHSVLYGISAVLIALGIGWGVSSLMQRI